MTRQEPIAGYGLHRPDAPDLVRFTLFRMATKCLLHLERSHLLIDGISRGILLGELSANYNGTGGQLPPAPGSRTGRTSSDSSWPDA
jgi:hypothetical protein